MRIILLTGWSESGKDTIADILVLLHGFKKYAFADPLKDLCSQLYGFPREWSDTQEGKKKIWKMGYKEKTIRDILLETALVDRKRFGDEIYVNEILKKIRRENPERVVISDLRWHTELTPLRAFAAGNGHSLEVWKVIREGQTESPVKDPSENYMTDLEPDYTLLNPGISISLLEEKVSAALDRETSVPK